MGIEEDIKCCCSKKKVESERREVLVQPTKSPEKTLIRKAYCNNEVVTSQYTLLSFLPQSLYEQFSKISNFWFLLVSFVFIWAETPLSAYTTVVPLVIVVGFSMLKDAYDDLKRHIRDRELNNIRYSALCVDEEANALFWEDIHARDIHVGDIIRVDDNQEVPCDLLALASTNITRDVNIITANLDGETNVKKVLPVQSRLEFMKRIPKDATKEDPFPVERVKATYKCSVSYDQPTRALDEFHGAAYFPDRDKTISLGIENLLLRGVRLRQTEFVVGVALYTGRDTKLSLNTKKAKKKFSVAERKLNTNILILIAIALGFSLILKIIEHAWFLRDVAPRSFYLPTRDGRAWFFVQDWLASILIFVYLIPISIIVSFEIVQLFAAMFIHVDRELIEEKTGLRGRPNTTSLADQLGQVEFLFSDKTGTLTQNVMKFRACTLADSEDVFYAEPDGFYHHQMQRDEMEVEIPRYITTGQTRLDSLSRPLSEFWLAVALCNTVQVEHRCETAVTLEYQSSSPDEEALVQAASELGVHFLGTVAQLNLRSADGMKPVVTEVERRRFRHCRTDSEVEQNVLGEMSKRRVLLLHDNFAQNELTNDHLVGPHSANCIYQVDDLIEFDSTRKRMTVLARYPDGRRFVLSKGAETSMTHPEACSASSDSERSRVLRKVTDFALLGLRTLVISAKEVSETEYRSLLDALCQARATVGSERDEALAQAHQAVESNMQLLGVTGVEDKLQDGIKPCIESLREAGIQVWVLTGDKEETAVSVSQAAGHLPEGVSVIRVVGCRSMEEASTRIMEQSEGLRIRLDQLRRNRQLLARLQSTISSVSKFRPDRFSLAQWILNRGPPGRIRRRHKKHVGAGGESVALVIDGASLKYALLPALQDHFLELCMNSTTVLCCRVSPLQKAGVVRMVSEGLERHSADKRRPVTAAIGDGGNDVSMILQADVGVGLYGKEGMHAVRSADYALPCFAYLQRLLLVHGSWTYQRITMMMLYFYFKCTCLITPDALHEFFSGFSDQALFTSLYYTLFNLTMTSLPPLAYAIQDKFLPAKRILQIPRIYRAFARDLNLRVWNLLLWMLMGFTMGCVAYFLNYALFGLDVGSVWWAANQKPYQADLTVMATSIYIWLWLGCMLHCLIMSRNLTWIVAVISAFTLLANILLFYIIDATSSNAYTGSPARALRSGAFWLGLLLFLALAMLPSLVWRMSRDWYWSAEEKYAASFLVSAESESRNSLLNPSGSFKTSQFGTTNPSYEPSERIEEFVPPRVRPLNQASNTRL